MFNIRIGQAGAGINDSPVGTAVGALECSARGAGVKRGWGGRVNGQAFNLSIGQAAAEGRPANTAIGTLKYAIKRAGVQDRWGDWVDDQTTNISTGQASIDDKPADAAVTTLEHAAARRGCVKSARGDRIDGQASNIAKG